MPDSTNGMLNEEQVLILDTIRKYAQESVAPGASERDLERSFPTEAFAGLAELGLIGVAFPEAIGGVEMGHLTHALVVEEVAYACGATAMTLVAQANLALGAVHLAGTPEQHETWGVPLAMGDPIGGLVLGVDGYLPGPDGDGITATPAADGWTLNGTVPLVVNGSRAGTLVVLAATGEKTAGLFLVSGDAAGLTRGTPLHTGGFRALDQASVTCQDVAVPAANVLGDATAGHSLVQQILDHARVARGAVAVGLARSALDKTVAYSKERQAFNKPLAAFAGILERIAAMATATESARQLVYAAARAQDSNTDFAELAAMAQIQAGRVAGDVAYDAVQIFGGYGYCHEYEVERLQRDAVMVEVGIEELDRVRNTLARQVVGT